jgi:threonine dehydrogenase-like Zn-dependent dehydrogenase
MKAFVLRAPRKLECAELPIPEPGPGQVRVKVAYSGICGSDVEAYLGHRQPEWLSDPSILGHEAAGVVDAVGPHTPGVQPGDRVMLAAWGSFADYAISDLTCVMKLLPKIPLIRGSLIEPLPGILRAATCSGITHAHDVVVVGQGLSGLPMTRLVALHGCRRLIAVDLFDEKLALAQEFGATHTINADREDVRERILDITSGGADYTIIATCSGDDVPPAVEWSRKHARIILYGGIGPCAGIDFFRVHCKAVTIAKETTDTGGMLEQRRLWRDGMQLVVDGLLDVERLRTHIFPLERLPEAMELRATPRPDVIHVLIESAWVRQERERSSDGAQS